MSKYRIKVEFSECGKPSFTVQKNRWLWFWSYMSWGGDYKWETLDEAENCVEGWKKIDEDEKMEKVVKTIYLKR